jgi:hypothetical protein
MYDSDIHTFRKFISVPIIIDQRSDVMQPGNRVIEQNNTGLKYRHMQPEVTPIPLTKHSR